LVAVGIADPFGVKRSIPSGANKITQSRLELGYLPLDGVLRPLRSRP
jgi:hypothetical protein